MTSSFLLGLDKRAGYVGEWVVEPSWRYEHCGAGCHSYSYGGIQDSARRCLCKVAQTPTFRMLGHRQPGGDSRAGFPMLKAWPVQPPANTVYNLKFRPAS